MKNYYDILEIHQDSSQEVVEAAYKALHKHFDPENFTDPQEKTQAQIRRNGLEEAYHILSDPKKRASYDEFFKKTDGKVETKFTNATLLVIFVVTILIIVLAKYIADILFSKFGKATQIIATSPLLQLILLIVLVGIAIHYFWKNYKK